MSKSDVTFEKLQVEEAKKALPRNDHAACNSCLALQHVACISCDVGVLCLDGIEEIKNMLKEDKTNAHFKIPMGISAFVAAVLVGVVEAAKWLIAR